MECKGEAKEPTRVPILQQRVSVTSRHKPKPLREFNYRLVSERLDGLLINVDRDLQRLGNGAMAQGENDRERGLTLLNVLVRFAKNSYDAVRYTQGTPQRIRGGIPTTCSSSPQ
jgi:hypothetical protein